MDAELIVGDGSVRPLRALAAEALEDARAVAPDLGAEDALDEVERLLREGGGAERARDAHRRGGMDRLLADLLARTAAAGTGSA